MATQQPSGTNGPPHLYTAELYIDPRRDGHTPQLLARPARLAQKYVPAGGDRRRVMPDRGRHGATAGVRGCQRNRRYVSEAAAAKRSNYSITAGKRSAPAESLRLIRSTSPQGANGDG